MQNIWSENKKVNILVNVLLFLMAINFLGYGHLMVPITCLVIFLNNNRKFYVNNIKTFILLVVFGLSFYFFSYKLGIYGTIGLFLPMVYYIGSNIKKPDETKIKYIIYILTFGMGAHVLLNFSCDLIVRGFSTFFRNSHLDFWTWDEYPTTQTSVLYLFFIGVIYYIIVYEKNKKIKSISILTFIIMFIYEIALGRRTTLLIPFLVNSIALFIDFFVLKNRNKTIKMIIGIEIALGIFIIFVYFFYELNLFGLHDQLIHISIIRKFETRGLFSYRTYIFADAIKLMPEHLFGGTEISAILDNKVHDLWMDTYDYAGIIPFILLLIHSIGSTLVYYRFYKNKKIDLKFRFMVFVLFIGIFFEMFIEPIITGSSIFFLSSLLVFSLIENLKISRL